MHRGSAGGDSASGVPFVIQPHGSLDPHLRKKNQLVKQVYMATVGRPLLRKAAAVVFDTPEEGATRIVRSATSRMDAADGPRPRGLRSAAAPRHVPRRVPAQSQAPSCCSSGD